jgi:hypothetical protein
LTPHALEDLKILTQSDLERERYEARRKAQLDRNTDLKEARQEGEKIGLIRSIHAFEQLLKRPLTFREQLAKLSLQELTRLADELQEQVAKHG